MNKQQIEEKVLDIIQEICDDDIIRTEKEINLLDEGLIDSLDYIDMLVQFEEAFDIIMSPSEFTREEMDTPAKIIYQVEKRVG
ncbi:D-alanine--poly(phosphoribitol) ligase subunit DltC [Eubacteriales bacterium KG127]